jgi:hypothetical protein
LEETEEEEEEEEGEVGGGGGGGGGGLTESSYTQIAREGGNSQSDVFVLATAGLFAITSQQSTA